MSRLNRQQKEMVQQFVEFTGCSDKEAASALKASSWNLEMALNLFYEGSHAFAPVRSSVDPSKQEKMFLKYKDPEVDKILLDGVMKLCTDLELDPGRIEVLQISHKMGAATMGEYSREEFLQGLAALSVDSTEGLKAALPRLRQEIGDDSIFKTLYMFAFDWSKEQGQKSLAQDSALPMCQLLLGPSGRKWPLIEHWCCFLQVRHNKAISRDTWVQLLEFTKVPDLTFTKYDSSGAWPYLIDEFVDYLRDKGEVPRLQSSGS